MTKTKYDEVLEQIDLIKKQADFYLSKVKPDSKEKTLITVLSDLQGITRLFKKGTGPFVKQAKGESACPPGTYDCDEYCSATPCWVGQIAVPYSKDNAY